MSEDANTNYKQMLVTRCKEILNANKHSLLDTRKYLIRTNTHYRYKEILNTNKYPLLDTRKY